MGWGDSGWGDSTWADSGATPAPPITITANVTSVVRVAPAQRSAVLPPLPTPQPGPFGAHDYEVAVVDMFGIVQGVIPSAVPTQIDYDLDDVGQATIDFWIMDPQARKLLPPSSMPWTEIQIWRDQVLIAWVVPVTATFDATTVHLTCQDLLWYLANRMLGPTIPNPSAPPPSSGLLNPDFEDPAGLTGWTATNCTASVETTLVASGTQAARLVQPAAGQEAYLSQVVTVTAPPSPFPGNFLGLTGAAWCYVDPNYAYAGPADQQYGLTVHDHDTGDLLAAVELPIGTALGTYTRLELPNNDTSTAVQVLQGTTRHLEFRLYCPGGSVVWDACRFDLFEAADISESGYGDVRDIIAMLVGQFAQGAPYGQSPLNLQVWGPETGKQALGYYQLFDQQAFLELLNNFPAQGLCDFGIQWSADGLQRALTVFSPLKGLIKWNYPVEIGGSGNLTALNGSVDASQVGTVQRFLGQGSSGPSQDIGYAAFASYLGGKTNDAGLVVYGASTVQTPPGFFTADDVGQLIFSLAGAFPVGTYITNVINDHQVDISLPARISVYPDTIGVGGLTIDRSTSGLANTPLGLLQPAADASLQGQMRPQALPAPKMRADGPRGLFGNVEPGDVVPVVCDYGWLTQETTLMRVAKMTLYPPTEELELQLMNYGPPVVLE